MTLMTRRDWLANSACGFGSLALAGLCAEKTVAAFVSGGENEAVIFEGCLERPRGVGLAIDFGESYLELFGVDVVPLELLRLVQVVLCSREFRLQKELMEERTSVEHLLK